MKKFPYILLAIIAFVNVGIINAQDTKEESKTDGFTFKAESARINASLWAIPYRFEDKELKTTSIKVTFNTNGTKVINTNLLSLVDSTNKIRMRPSGIYYLRANDKRKYLKAKASNKNYTFFEDNSLKGYTNLQAKSFKPNFFGKKKKDEIASIKSIKKVTVKETATYFIDFPVKESFKEADLYYKKVKIATVRVE